MHVLDDLMPNKHWALTNWHANSIEIMSFWQDTLIYRIVDKYKSCSWQDLKGFIQINDLDKSWLYMQIYICWNIEDVE